MFSLTEANSDETDHPFPTRYQDYFTKPSDRFTVAEENEVSTLCPQSSSSKTLRARFGDRISDSSCFVQLNCSAVLHQRLG